MRDVVNMGGREYGRRRIWAAGICMTLYKIAECAIIVTVGEVPTMILEI